MPDAKNVLVFTCRVTSACGVIVIPDLIGNPEKSMLDSRFRGNDSLEVRNLPTRLRGYLAGEKTIDRTEYVFKVWAISQNCGFFTH